MKTRPPRKELPEVWTKGYRGLAELEFDELHQLYVALCKGTVKAPFTPIELRQWIVDSMAQSFVMLISQTREGRARLKKIQSTAKAFLEKPEENIVTTSAIIHAGFFSGPQIVDTYNKVRPCQYTARTKLINWAAHTRESPLQILAESLGLCLYETLDGYLHGCTHPIWQFYSALHAPDDIVLITQYALDAGIGGTHFAKAIEKLKLTIPQQQVILRVLEGDVERRRKKS